MQTIGISIGPVSLKSGSTPLMSWFICGVKVIVMVVERPAESRPEGVYWIKKKSYVQFLAFLFWFYLETVMKWKHFEGVE